MKPLETFSEGTPFQPLFICFIYRGMIGNGRTFRFAIASYRPKGIICERAKATSQGHSCAIEILRGSNLKAEAVEDALDLRIFQIEFLGLIGEPSLVDLFRDRSVGLNRRQASSSCVDELQYRCSRDPPPCWMPSKSAY